MKSATTCRRATIGNCRNWRRGRSRDIRACSASTWAFVAHTDSHFDPDTLRRFILAYQRVQPLTIGELWAVAITLRIVLIENLRRLADQITAGLHDRERPMRWRRLHGAATGDRMVRSKPKSPRARAGRCRSAFAAELAKQLRDQDPSTTPAYGWLEEQPSRCSRPRSTRSCSASSSGKAASNVTARNIVNSMRLISDIDWSELFET